MVFTSLVLFARRMSTPHPDRFWRRRKILKLAAHFYGRKQNCYTIALRAVIKALQNTNRSREVKVKEKNELLITRLTAACEEHGFTYPLLKESLIRSNILLNKKVLVDLAIWEPRTFKCITDFAWNKAKSEEIKGINDLGEPPKGVVLKPTPLK